MAEVASGQLASDLVHTISELLTKNQLKEAHNAINDNKYSTCLKDNSWDLIPIIVSHLDQETLESNQDLFECCENMLQVVADKSNPEEALLEFIEQAELALNDTKFIAILQALQKVLLKLINKRGRSLEWSFNTIQAHVTKLPLPGEHGLEDEETAVLDADEAVSRITSFYAQLLPFYEPFVAEVEVARNRQRRDLLTCFMLQLLGRPLACLDLETSAGTKSHTRQCAEHIMAYLGRLVPDCYIFLRYAGDKRQPSADNDSVGVDLFASEDRAPSLSLGVYYYLLLSENVNVGVRPVVYGPLYVFQSALHLAAELLRQPEQFAMRKGLLLAHALVSGRHDPLPHDALDSPAHCRFCDALLNVTVYSDLRSCRELAVNVFKTYMFLWDARGRYLLVWHLMHTVRHVNARAYVVARYKDMLHEAVRGGENRVCEWFAGARLRRMLDSMCALPSGRESDLMELGDQLLTALNLLTFLALRDRFNVTGVWDHFPVLERRFLCPLKQAIDISKAHYELRMNEVREERAGGKAPVDVKVAGHCLPSLNHQDQMSVLYSAINSFEALEMLLARLHELIEDPPR